MPGEMDDIDMVFYAKFELLSLAMHSPFGIPHTLTFPQRGSVQTVYEFVHANAPAVWIPHRLAGLACFDVSHSSYSSLVSSTHFLRCSSCRS